MEKKIWVSSDFHFGHNKPFLYEPRGFTSIEEHDHALIENWNSVVGAEDEAYVLGDIMLNDNERGLHHLRQLKGHLHIICGNHDTDARRALYSTSPNVVEVTDAGYLKAGKYRFFLCHYPTKVGNFDDAIASKKFYSLCGHAHTSERFLDFSELKSYHVELDAHDMYPVSLDTIISDISSYRPQFSRKHYGGLF